MMQIVKELGGELAGSVLECTHLVTDKVGLSGLVSRVVLCDVVHSSTLLILCILSFCLSLSVSRDRKCSLLTYSSVSLSDAGLSFQ